MPENFANRLESLREVQNEPSKTALIALDFLLDVQPDAQRLRVAVTAAAVPHWFDKPVLAQLLSIPDEPDAAGLLKQLVEMPMIEPFAGPKIKAHNVHETTRLALRKQLFISDRDLIRTLSGRAITSFGNSPQPELVTERLYHQFLYEPENAANTCESLLRDWINEAQPQVKENLRGALTELVECDMLNGRPLAEALMAICWIGVQRGEFNKLDDQIARILELTNTVEETSTIGRALCLDGDIQVARGNLDHAVSAFRKGISHFITLVASDPNSWEHRIDLAVGYAKLGAALQAQGRLADAIQAYENSLASNSLAADLKPGDSRWKSNRVITQVNYCNVLISQGRISDALTYIERSLEMAEYLVESNQENLDWQHYLSIVLMKLGDVYLSQGYVDKTYKAYIESHDISFRLVTSNPDIPNWQMQLTAIRSRLGDVASAQNRPDYTLVEYRSNLDQAKNLADRDSTNLVCQQYLAMAHTKVGDAFYDNKQFDDGMVAYASALQIYQTIIEKDHSNADWKNNFGAVCSKTGKLLLLNNHSDVGLKLLRVGAHTFEQLLKGSSDNVHWQNGLSVVYGHLASYWQARQKFTTAVSFWAKSLKIRRTIASIDSTSAYDTYQLSVALINLSSAEKLAGKHYLSRKHKGEGIRMFKMVSSAHKDHLKWNQEFLEYRNTIS